MDVSSSFLSFFYVSVEGYKNLCDVLCLFEWMLNRKISRFSSPPFLVHFSAFVLISHPSIAPPPPALSSSFVCKVLNFKSGRQKEHSQKNYRFSFSSPLLLFLPSSEHSLYSVTRLSRPPTRRRKSRFGTPVTEGGGDGEEGKILNFKLLSTRTLITSSSRAAVEKKYRNEMWNWYVAGRRKSENFSVIKINNIARMFAFHLKLNFSRINIFDWNANFALSQRAHTIIVKVVSIMKTFFHNENGEENLLGSL